MDKTTMRKQNVAQKLAQKLHEIKLEREHIQNQAFVWVAPSDEEMRISNELYNLRLNMGENLQPECTF